MTHCRAQLFHLLVSCTIITVEKWTHSVFSQGNKIGNIKTFPNPHNAQITPHAPCCFTPSVPTQMNDNELERTALHRLAAASVNAPNMFSVDILVGCFG